MDIRNALNLATKKLQPRRITCSKDINRGRLEAEVLLAGLLGKDRAWLLTHDEARLSPAQGRRFSTWVGRRTRHEPVAQILGYKDFYGRRFAVDKHVLIPRPETELLIETALASMTGKDVAWDVGTGSGAIAITLAAERPKAAVMATDVSVRALAVAKRNARTHKAKVDFVKSDLLQPAAYRWLHNRATKGTQLLICANLPYLPMSDKTKLELDVVKFEPSKALFSGKEGNDLILRFLGQLARHLPEWGYGKKTLLFEFDPPQAKTLQEAAQKLFPSAKTDVLKDLAGRERLLKLSF